MPLLTFATVMDGERMPLLTFAMVMDSPGSPLHAATAPLLSIKCEAATWSVSPCYESGAGMGELSFDCGVASRAV